MQASAVLAVRPSLRLVNWKVAGIFKRILEAWNPAKNGKKSAKSGGRKIYRVRVYHAGINHDTALREAHELLTAPGCHCPSFGGSARTKTRAASGTPAARTAQLAGKQAPALWRSKSEAWCLMLRLSQRRPKALKFIACKDDGLYQLARTVNFKLKMIVNGQNSRASL